MSQCLYVLGYLDEDGTTSMICIAAPAGLDDEEILRRCAEIDVIDLHGADVRDSPFYASALEERLAVFRGGGHNVLCLNPDDFPALRTRD